MAEQQSQSQTPLGEESVDRIRDIIFGPQIRDYDRRFASVAQELKRLQGELDRLRQQLSNQESVRGEQMDTTREEFRQAKASMREEFQQGMDRLASQLAKQDSAQGESLGNLRQALHESESNLRGELHRIAEQLTVQKIDRLTLGNLLVEAGNQIKANDPAERPRTGEGHAE